MLDFILGGIVDTIFGALLEPVIRHPAGCLLLFGVVGIVAAL